MKVIETGPQEYQSIVKSPFSIFDSVEFCSLNEKKVDSIKYLLFDDGKYRFGLIAGVRDGHLQAPFSAPYACFSEVNKNNKVSSYSGLANSLLIYARSQGLLGVRVTFPPSVYDESHIAKLYNSFYNSGFRIAGCDLNFQYDLKKFSAVYEMSIDPKARQKLRAAVRNGLSFKKTDDLYSAYEVIRLNREEKGYPLRLTVDDVKDVVNVIKTDFFVVETSDRIVIAAAMVYEVSKGRVQIIYWGNTPGTDDYKPMNFLAFNIFNFYFEKGMSFIDIGPSTEYSVPNFGLCDFKQSIGCGVSSKITFELET